MYLGGPLGLMSIGLMAILVRGLGLLMLGVASTAGQLLGSVLIDVLIPSLGNSVYPLSVNKQHRYPPGSQGDRPDDPRQLQNGK